MPTKRLFTLAVDTDNDAFQDGNLGDELARLLRKLADDFSDGGGPGRQGTIVDINGNSVGVYRCEELDPDQVGAYVSLDRNRG